MKIAVGDEYQWHRVPFAWLPQRWDNTVYWLEQPPYERRAKWWHPFVGFHWEHRRNG